MKNLIMFFVLVMVMAFSNYEVSYSQNIENIKTGNFYFLIGTEGNERAIMYLHIVGNEAYGSYYTESQSIIRTVEENGGGFGGFSGSFDGRNLNLEYSYYDNNERLIEGTIKGTLSSDIVFRGKHNSKNVNLSLANATVNTMKIFDYMSNYGRYHSTKIIHPAFYNEQKLIREYKDIGYSYDEWAIEAENEYELNGYEFAAGGMFSDKSESIYYIDNKIVIIEEYDMHTSYSGGGTVENSSFRAHSINSKFEYGNEIKISDFIANTKDRRLLSLIKNKEEDIEIDDIEDCAFSISPKGTITIYYRYFTYLEVTFTFEELKPFIKRGSVLDYLFN